MLLDDVLKEIWIEISGQNIVIMLESQTAIRSLRSQVHNPNFKIV